MGENAASCRTINVAGYTGKYFFLSYFRLKSASDARYLQVALMEKNKQPVVLDVSYADVIREIITEGLARSNALALLQTKMVLRALGC